jgi:hypothetical protein
VDVILGKLWGVAGGVRVGGELARATDLKPPRGASKLAAHNRDLVRIRITAGMFLRRPTLAVPRLVAGRRTTGSGDLPVRR